jgi:von Willebrand factor type A domain-containing protein/uncharacterized protein DUF11
VSRRRWVAWALPVLFVLTAATPARPAAPPRVQAAPGLSPTAVTQLVPPGAFTTLRTAVQTPRIPQLADIVLLVDGTASMLPTIAQVKSDLGTILDPLTIGADAARVGVVAYRDTTDDGDGTDAFQVLSPLSGDRGAVTRAIGALQAFGGSPDAAEDWINALVQVASGGAGTFRPGATPILVLVGDAPSHDPSRAVTDPANPPDDLSDIPSHTLSDALAALVAQHVQLLALGVRQANGTVTSGGGLDSAGQAASLAPQTGGLFVDGIVPDQVAATVAGKLVDRPTTASHQASSCDPGLSVTLDPPDRTVTSGTDAAFAERVEVAADAAQGATLTCTVQFGLSALPGGTGGPALPELRQTISVRVQDVTPADLILDDQAVRTTDPAGTVVTYQATALDALDGLLTPDCAPASGTLFPPGATAVSCSATDRSGNVARRTAVMQVIVDRIPRSDVRILNMAVKPNPGFAGAPVTVSAVLSNLGTDPANGVVFTPTLPPGASTVGAIVGGCTAAAPCRLAVGERRTLTFAVTYPGAVSGTVRGTATVASPQDSNPANNTRTAALTVVVPTIVVTPTVARPGQVVLVRGTHFPPGTVVDLSWLQPAITAGHNPVVVAANGSFTAQVLVLRKDQLGPRTLQVTTAGVVQALSTAVLVTRSTPLPMIPAR